MAPAAPVRAARPRGARGDAGLPPISDGTAPAVAGGIDAAIERSHHATRVATGDVVRLARPRGGVADDLKLIRGVGPKLEALLNAAGIWHFDQIATWKARDIAEIDAALKGFHGRITRDGWVKQARTFVAMGTAGRTTARTAGRTQRKKADS
jgi:NADH-quinone oxidoreductase subunit E